MYASLDPFKMRSMDTCQITLAIGSEVKDSTVQLSQMVRCVLFAVLVILNAAPERCVCRNVWYTLRDIQTDEQHGRKTRMSLAMVHYVSRGRFLVLHRSVVVSAVILGIGLGRGHEPRRIMPSIQVSALAIHAS